MVLIPQQYIYIVQASNETNTCKIGITNDLERRLKDYNNITGISDNTKFKYLFTCEVKDMMQVENDIKEEFRRLREKKIGKYISSMMIYLRIMLILLKSIHYL
jgi:predicted GIY-YIG superfamily endonuclease